MPKYRAAEKVNEAHEVDLERSVSRQQKRMWAAGGGGGESEKRRGPRPSRTCNIKIPAGESPSMKEKKTAPGWWKGRTGHRHLMREDIDEGRQ